MQVGPAPLGGALRASSHTSCSAASLPPNPPPRTSTRNVPARQQSASAFRLCIRAPWPLNAAAPTGSGQASEVEAVEVEVDSVGVAEAARYERIAASLMAKSRNVVEGATGRGPGQKSTELLHA